MISLEQFFNQLWLQYTQICPQATTIHHLFETTAEPIVNDHVTFRTFGNSELSIDILQEQILALGYTEFDRYHFNNKKLNARSYVHKNSPTKIFTSELLWRQLSDNCQAVIKSLLAKISERSPAEKIFESTYQGVGHG
ncbi:MAG: DUF1338 family protein [Psychromonas sp.]|nr:DUF1338 family protein [Psychromonas sp.]